jgi:uncharacterized membrane protein
MEPTLFKRIRKFILPIIALWLIVIYWQEQVSLAPTATLGNTTSFSTRAEVSEILEAGEVNLGGSLQEYQVLAVEAKEGPWAGDIFEIDFGKRQLRAAGPLLKVGDEIIVTISETPDQQVFAYFVDFVRTPALLVLLIAFVVVTLVTSGWKGVKSLVAMLVSFTIIIGYILPAVLSGTDPVLVSIFGAIMILAITLYLVYGWTIKTHAAVLGIVFALALTGVLANYFVDLTRMTGFGSEEAMFLSQESNAISNFRGLVLAGIIIGSLGVLDDLVITQASLIFELYFLDPSQKFRALFQRGMRVGQDHVAAAVNTLFLAYTGAALPLLLLVSGGGNDWFTFLNREFVAEEIVRTLVGSLGLISAIPFTTALACIVAINMPNFGRFRRFLGPAVQEAGEGQFSQHHH